MYISESFGGNGEGSRGGGEGGGGSGGGGSGAAPRRVLSEAEEEVRWHLEFPRSSSSFPLAYIYTGFLGALGLFFVERFGLCACDRRLYCVLATPRSGECAHPLRSEIA